MIPSAWVVIVVAAVFIYRHVRLIGENSSLKKENTSLKERLLEYKLQESTRPNNVLGL